MEPYYFSYSTSNAHYGFTTQIPPTYLIATTRRKPSVEWLGNTFKFVTLIERKFFGYRREKVFDVEVNMAEPEKSLVDSFDKPQYAGGVEELARITWRGLRRAERRKLVDYALRMESHSLIQRMGFMIDFLAGEGLAEPLPTNLRDRMLEYVGKATIYLDHRRPRAGEFYKDWKIINNVPEEQLLGEIEVK